MRGTNTKSKNLSNLFSNNLLGCRRKCAWWRWGWWRDRSRPNSSWSSKAATRSSSPSTMEQIRSEKHLRFKFLFFSGFLNLNLTLCLFPELKRLKCSLLSSSWMSRMEGPKGLGHILDRGTWRWTNSTLVLFKLHVYYCPPQLFVEFTQFNQLNRLSRITCYVYIV